MANTRKPKRNARKVLARPAVVGWKTTDEQEIDLRRWRGCSEIVDVEALEPRLSVFGTFRARSTSGSAYDVEIRDLLERNNSCGCLDHRAGGLGTCKHIEGVLASLKKKTGARAFKAKAHDGSPRIEVFLTRNGTPRPMVLWPRSAGSAEARAWLRPLCDRNGRLKTSPATIAALLDKAPSAPAEIRISRHLGTWLERERRLAAHDSSRRAFLGDIDAGRATWEMLKHPLLPYQKEGALHLAFGQRALLADEMGLGKTIQAIAACEILARRNGIARVLVVSPASVKAEWEEQITRFTERSSGYIAGPRHERLKSYQAPAFFTLVNYEQVLNDVEEMNAVLKPDVVILDEAQRIKNWQTKTARKVKQLRSPYAFVLTGTPLENRIDETYSIVQYLDPEIFGSLFRFNREFYALDERGRPEGLRNLGELHRRLKGVMLRRRKRDVERELPGRSVKTFFVKMADVQAERYWDYETPARRLLAVAQKRPLTQDEFELLQKLLACMRMICDTPAILDPECRVSPKLEELEGVLTDLLEDRETKIVIFSEWVKMLEMVRELAAEMGVDCAWHTGQVPQLKRRTEIARFREDRACRIFLSSDAGAVGLNLQMASAVINLDLPWNPAKLEQRIGRVWRKGQTRAVTVINLVAENSIEHSILHLLSDKQTLADGVLDGADDFAAIKLPSGRAAMIDRMQAMLGRRSPPPLKIVPPEERLIAELTARLGARLLVAEHCAGRIIAIVDGDQALIQVERDRLAGRDDPALPVEFIDRAGWETMQRLAQAGLVQFSGDAARLKQHTLPNAQPLLQAAE